MITLIVTFPDLHTEAHAFVGDRERNLELIELKKALLPNCTFEVIEA